MKKLLLFSILGVLLIVMTACGGVTTEENTDVPHSGDWNEISEKLYQQCQAKIKESWEDMSALYSYKEDTYEYMDFKKQMLEEFSTVSTLDCVYDLKKIDFSEGKTVAKVYATLNRFDVSRLTREKKSYSIEFPLEDNPDALKFKLMDGEWKLCPTENCEGAHSDLYSCDDGSIVDIPEQCPTFTDVELTDMTFADCFKQYQAFDQIFPENIGPYQLNPDSVEMTENEELIIRTEENALDKFMIIKSYKADYQHKEDNKRIFSLLFRKVQEPNDFEQMDSLMIEELRTAKTKNNGTINTTSIRGAKMTGLDFSRDPIKYEDRFKIVTNVRYISVPEKNTILRYNFNGWVVEDNLQKIVETHSNLVCR
ncbi:hypothetical protein KY336_00555 [Candidatus Woesearchaeota archaeon]|nr:hypothetical protein [Candidatus Woesearchaeota archaeon]